MFGRLFRKWRGGSQGGLLEIPADTSSVSRPREMGEPENVAPPERFRSSNLPPSEKDEAPSTIPPGWTLREYLNHGIQDRSRWLEGRYGRDKESADHRLLLESLRDSTAVAIRRPPLAAQRLLQENRREIHEPLGSLAVLEWGLGWKPPPPSPPFLKPYPDDGQSLARGPGKPSGVRKPRLPRGQGP